MALVVEQLRKAYPIRAGSLTVLRNVDLKLERGESAAIVGPSGSGKSTFLHLLGTLDEPTEGTIRLDGEDPFARSEAELADFRNRYVGFVFQDHYLLPQCSVLENVLVPTLASPATGDDEVGRARQLLDRVGLSERLDHRPAELSGGERQRVAIARALIRRPRLVLADEPTGNLDRANALAVGELLLDIHRKDQTILVVVTHSTELANLFPRRFEMNEGTLREPGALP